MADFLVKNWLLSINGVDCNIFTGPDGESPPIEEAVTVEGRKGIVQFLCPWLDRNELIAGLVGTVDYQNGAIVRTAPFLYPVADRDNRSRHPGRMFADRWFCTAIAGIRGIKWRSDETGKATGLAGWGSYVYAVLTAEFTAPPYLIGPLAGGGGAFNDLRNQPYCVSKLRVSGEVTAPPTGALVYDEGTFHGRKLDDANAGFILARYELSCTRMRMPIVPVKTMEKLIGTTNTTTMKIGANTISPGAALFMGYNPEPRSDPYNGGIVHDIEMSWLVNGLNSERNADSDWNWKLDPGGSWSAVAFNVDQAPKPRPFVQDNHDDLFSDTVS